MPYTEKQRRAGCAAASGKGKLGIPKKVGAEMCRAPKKKAKKRGNNRRGS